MRDGEHSRVDAGVACPARVAGSHINTIQYCIDDTNGEVSMVVEYIRYTVPAARAASFVEAYRKAGEVLQSDPHCAAFEVARGVEEPEHFVVRIEWDSVEGHEQGFRASLGFREFYAAVRPFFADIEEMKHYAIQHQAA
jgi:heme-degrading monooxygenase HmoA